MLTKTSLSAIRALLVLGGDPDADALSPRAIAAQLGESPSYMAKVTSMLSRAGILRTQRGAGGGVRLALPPSRITLLAVVEACQGSLTPHYCMETPWTEATCAFHQAAVELHRAMVKSLSHWTLERLLEKPSPGRSMRQICRCSPARPKRKTGSTPLHSGRPAP